MTNKVEIKQEANKSEETFQIGVQNIYNISASEEYMQKLFDANFPKLIEKAQEIIDERIGDLSNSIISKLIHYNIRDFSAFSDPDFQYVLYEAQKNYARFGTKDKLEILSTIIAKRIQYGNDDICLKIAIDNAISIASQLNTNQLDLLALLFLTSKVKISSITDLKSLKEHLDYISKTFECASASSIEYLNSLGCLRLHLYDPIEVYSETYEIDKKDIESICPLIIKQLKGDYSTSHVGTVLAIIYIESKTPFSFDSKIWIHS